MHALEVSELRFAYGNAAVLNGVDFHVDPAEIVTIIGPNGAGKSTLLNVISRSLRVRDGRVVLHGRDVTRATQRDMVRGGCLLVPEGRQVFGALTVRDNLLLGMYVRRRKAQVSAEIDRVYELFPRLAEREKQAAGTLSGGEQQMLAIGRALMGKPTVMLLDEPSLGLAPLMVERIMNTLGTLREDGLTIVLVEQNAQAALALADRGYLLHTGRVMAAGTGAELASDPVVRQVYLGAAPANGR